MQYQTPDGLIFYNEQEGQNHANGLGYKEESDKAFNERDYEKAIFGYDHAIPLLSEKA